MCPERLALFTTVHPTAMPYLASWYASLRAQTDDDFTVWIATDGVRPAAAIMAMGGDPHAHWVVARPGSSPTAVRGQALARLLQDDFDAVVFVDSDDELAPTRVAAARRALADADGVACALRLVDERADDLGVTLAVPAAVDAAQLLPSRNVFGLSNTAYRSSLLRRCLPMPADTPLADWYLATRAWGLGARLVFDPEPHMAYRQHGANLARLLAPFEVAEVRRAAHLVLRHHAALASLAPDALAAAQRAALVAARQRVRTFVDAIERVPARLERYVEALNQLPPEFVWWWHVAHPDLEELWIRSS